MKINKYWTIFALSLTVISIETIWTRIFSAEFFYTFAFLILSLSVFGLSLGGLALRLFKFYSGNGKFELMLNLTALSVLIGPPLVFILDVDFSKIFSSLFSFIGIIFLVLILGSTFFFAGVALAKLFKENNQDMPKLYMYDMLGAGLGAVVSIIAMNLLQTPLASTLIAFPLLALNIISKDSKNKIFPSALVALMLLLAMFSENILGVKDEKKAQLIFTHWDALAKLKIYKYNDMYRGLHTDNSSSSTVIGFDGNYNRPDSIKYDFGINAEYLVKKFNKNCTFLALGAGGGKDVLQALLAGAKEVHAVEVNSYINYLMTEGSLAAFSGSIYNDPRVIVVNEDARSYIRRFDNKFDYIFSHSANTYAALASGAFALAENYLFTTEAFKDYWKALSPNGFLMVEHQFYVPRMVSELISALKELNIKDYKNHFAMYKSKEWHREIILVSKAPLTNEIINNAFMNLDSTPKNILELVYPARPGRENQTLNQIVLQGWQEIQKEVHIDLSPTNDDRPFIAQLGLWKNFSMKNANSVEKTEFSGFPLSKALIVIILLIFLLIVIPVNLIPYFRKKEKKLNISAWLYFFAIGMGYMIIEVVLIQKYTLFIGASIYSFITVLVTLLLATGIGARYSENFPKYLPFILIVTWLLLDIFVFRHLLYSFGSFTLAPRIALTAILIFPVGFFMGAPFPYAARKVGDLIDWGFAVNGAASVFGSVIIMLIAFAYGFSVCLAIAALIYTVSYFLLGTIKVRK
ncbi:MAG: hypothetical protein NT007_04855 [Candidatus Kapabacteria bacterium]|nr:hypothetical protein [Candidatus Kapabacteria bacterium]